MHRVAGFLLCIFRAVSAAGNHSFCEISVGLGDKIATIKLRNFILKSSHWRGTITIPQNVSASVMSLAVLLCCSRRPVTVTARRVGVAYKCNGTALWQFPKTLSTLRRERACRSTVSSTALCPPLTLGATRHLSERRPPTNSSRGGMIASLGLGASFLFGKTKFLLGALKITKAGPLLSMLATSATYSLFFGWPYACGMVGLIFVHECGHLVVMRHYGVPFSPMVFVPFMGAVIAMKEYPANSYQEAVIAFGGPLLGTAGALAVGMMGQVNDSQLLYALADFGYMINLFNLMPIGQLDGGRIGNAISPAFGVAGLLGGGYLLYEGLISNPIFYLVMAGGAYSTTNRVFGWDGASKPRDYYNISYQDQGTLFALYAGLITGAMYLMRENNRRRKTPKQLEAEKQNPWAAADAPWQNDDGAVYDDFFANDKDMEGRRGGGGTFF